MRRAPDERGMPLASRPPRLAELVLRLTLPARYREQQLGDLGEAFLSLREETGQSDARRWYWRQVFKSVLPNLLLKARGHRKLGKQNLRPHIMKALVGDLKYAVRGHLRHPGLAAVAIVTLALGIGANAAIFSVANGVLLRPLPLGDPDRLVDIQVNSGIGNRSEWGGPSEPEFLDFGGQIASFAQVAAYTGSEVTIGDSSSTRRVRVLKASAELLPLLGVQPILGRFFTLEEDRPGPEHQPDIGRVLVLSHGMWQSEFGGDPDVIGRSLIVQDQSVTIVGVMPEGFEFPDSHWQAWTSLQLDRSDPWYRNNHYLAVVARLRPGSSIQEAQNEVDLLAARSTEEFPQFYPDPGYRARLRQFRTRIVGSVTTPLHVLMGAVAFVLLTACVNVANLLLASGEARKREIAIRKAVGASRLRMARQLLTENFVLAATGGIVGVLVAVLGVEALLALAPASLPRLNQVVVDGTVLGFSTAITLATGVVFGLLPALRSATTNTSDVLKEGGRAQGSSRVGNSIRRVLVATQVALAVLLVTGAGLMLRSVLGMYRVDTGFRTAGTITFRLHPPATKYDTPEAGVALYTELLDRIGSLPGVISASATDALPLSGYGRGRLSLVIEGQPAPTIGDAPAERVEYITPGYFETIGMTLIRGRTLAESDDVNSTAVVVVNESMARAHWPGQDPIGKRFRVHGGDPPGMEVIGVVSDVRNLALEREPEARWYVPHAQAYVSAYVSPLSMAVVVRSDTDPTTIMPMLRDAIRNIDDNVAISEVQTMEQVFANALEGERFVTVLLVVFGAVALFLAAIGIYGVISYAVSLRTHEIGIRMALGARGTGVLARTVCEGLTLTAVGVALGLVAAVALSRALSKMVFGITPTDPATYTGVVLVLASVAAMASLIPAWQASRVSPMLALREDN